MKVRTEMGAPDLDVPRRRLALLARRVLRGEESSLDLTIVFTDDTVQRELNRTYRAIDRTTDVLSFQVPGVARIAKASGEIYISVSQARRQARRYRHSLTSELERLVVHGVLHLLGHDHKRSGEAARMRALEDRYVERLSCP